MKTITICTTEFLAGLPHIPGPWKIDHNCITGHYLICEMCPGIPEERMYASRKLISYAPTMLRTICDTYLTLLVKFAFGQNETCNMIRISLDGTLADLRNKISLATELDCEQVQTIFEQYVIEIGGDPQT